MNHSKNSPASNQVNGVFRVAIILLGVSFVSFSCLLLEITLTRIFSATIWYHYAFMAISVALLGLGLGGIFVSFNREKLRRQMSYYATLATVFFSLYLVIYLCAISQFPFSLSLLPLYFFASVIPFFFAGVCAALIFDGFAHITNKIYFADLTGASIGCVSAEAILSFLAQNLLYFS
jgi:uncharacterized membrane protein YozB (DUF420 family)